MANKVYFRFLCTGRAKAPYAHPGLINLAVKCYLVAESKTACCAVIAITAGPASSTQYEQEHNYDE